MEDHLISCPLYAIGFSFSWTGRKKRIELCWFQRPLDDAHGGWPSSRTSLWAFIAWLSFPAAPFTIYIYLFHVQGCKQHNAAASQFIWASRRPKWHCIQGPLSLWPGETKALFFFSALKDNDYIEWSNKLCVLNKRRCCTVSRSVRDRQRDGKSWINGGGPVQNSFFSPVCYAFQNTRNTLRLGKHSLFKVSSSSNQKVIWYNQKRHCKIRKL